MSPVPFPISLDDSFTMEINSLLRQKKLPGEVADFCKTKWHVDDVNDRLARNVKDVYRAYKRNQDIEDFINSCTRIYNKK